MNSVPEQGDEHYEDSDRIFDRMVVHKARTNGISTIPSIMLSTTDEYGYLWHLVNPQFIVSVSETAEGSLVVLTVGQPILANESPMRIREMIQAISVSP